MNVIFKVNDKPILVIETINNSITKVDIISESLTQAAFPAALEPPNIANLNNLLRIYTNTVIEMSLEDIAEKYDGEISFIEFKPNLTIHFIKGKNDIRKDNDFKITEQM
ncbi:hypothetical protein [Leuconostoc citreum]|uniref:hypothetical protein n=1 Tax=Leuconostoc citreum TaxID=33964 RepID=UPI001303F3E1|nr:hypothetical protein [Leuconostoc citreum]KAF0261390.1 hypothetical protein CRI81_04280 [Leuconostoc citreum]